VQIWDIATGETRFSMSVPANPAASLELQQGGDSQAVAMVAGTTNLRVIVAGEGIIAGELRQMPVSIGYLGDEIQPTDV
jgi:hypothetical protein